MEKPSKEAWEILETDYPMNHRWCKIRRDKVRFPSGVVEDYFLNELPEVVLVFPVNEKGEVIFVRQYKHGAGREMLELPGGCFTPEKEEPLDAIRRELREETGMESQDWTYLGKMYENPTKATNEVYLFLARNVRKTADQQLDPTENISIESYPLSDIRDMVADGRICASTSIALVFRALEAL